MYNVYKYLYKCNINVIYKCNLFITFKRNYQMRTIWAEGEIFLEVCKSLYEYMEL